MDCWPTHHEPLPLQPPPFALPSHSSLALSIESVPSPSPSLSLKTAYPGLLSLHNYRKFLSQDGDSSPTADGQEGGKTLRRKNAAVNLNQTTTTQMGSTCRHVYHPFSVSSMTSSTPPLSPSYSPSITSEQLPEVLDGFGYPESPLDANQYDGALCDKQASYKLLDTFRDRLEKFPDYDSQDIIAIHGHTRARSDSVLLRSRRGRKSPTTATVMHHGASFEILNPHDSLNFAQIISYIEDVDSPPTSNYHRDSYPNTTDDPILVHQNPAPCAELIPAADEQKAHEDLVGDTPHHPMPSISELLQEDNLEPRYGHTPGLRGLSRPLSTIRPWTAQPHSPNEVQFVPDLDRDLGEPGPPIYFNHDHEDPYNHPSRLPNPNSHSAINLNTSTYALYDIGRLPEQGKGAQNPTTIIYSDRKALRKKSVVDRRKKRKAFSLRWVISKLRSGHSSA